MNRLLADLRANADDVEVSGVQFKSLACWGEKRVKGEKKSGFITSKILFGLTPAAKMEFLIL